MTGPTLSQIAAKIGVSKMTVSRALRGERHVAAQMRARVQAAAQEMGWQPDPEISKLMTHMRRGRRAIAPPTLAFVWSDTAENPPSPWARRLWEGALKRARRHGYELEEFYLGARGLTGRRLSGVLEARGIRGLVLSPLISRSRGHVSLRWESLSAVVIGLGYPSPALHRVHHHHFHGMMTVLRALKKQGRRRIGFYSESTVNERMFGAWAASFLTHHPLPTTQAARLLRLPRKPGREDFIKWLREARPEVIIDSGLRCVEWLASLPPESRPSHVTLNWDADRPEIPGLDQQAEVLGAAAVDLLVEQILCNERGVPEHPKMVMTAGVWRTAC